MRTPAEIAFRLKQEARNAWLLAAPPSLTTQQATPLAGLPNGAAVAARIRATPFAAELESLADSICDHRFPIFGSTIDTGPTIDWSRDYIHGKTNPQRYFRFIPYLDFERAGDHKLIWELNRHQHLILLAQAFLVTGNERYAREIVLQLESWMDANPFQRGINWTSALEVGVRALSWTWIYHFIGERFSAPFRARFLQTLYHHACYLETNPSTYFSPYNHLLGESVALHALGVLFPNFPRAERWRSHAGSLVESLIHKQVKPDGSYFEQATYYHVYALDMFLFHAMLARPTLEYRAVLARMAEYLDALLGPARVLPIFGDDDGGRFFHPYGALDAARIAPPAGVSRLFPDAGVAVLCANDVHIVIDAGPFGAGSSGHSHSDTLSLTVRIGNEEILIDPGTYTYTDPVLRNWFRSTAAHSTIRIDALDQAEMAGPFRWNHPPAVRVLEWTTDASRDLLVAECCYRGFTHHRRFEFLKPDRLLITDEVSGPPGEHEIEQFWQLGSPAARERFIFESQPEWIEGWRSVVFGTKTSSPILRLKKRFTLPCGFVTELRLA